MWCFAVLGTISTIKKTWKNTHEGVLPWVKACIYAGLYNLGSTPKTKYQLNGKNTRALHFANKEIHVISRVQSFVKFVQIHKSCEILEPPDLIHLRYDFVYWQLKTSHMRSWKSLFHTAWKVSKCGVFFWSVYSRIRTEYKDLFRKSPYSVRIWENMDQENSVFGHFSHSAKVWVSLKKTYLSISQLT